MMTSSRQGVADEAGDPGDSAGTSADGGTVVLRTVAEVRRLPRGARAVVMTMGALHEGHRMLMRAARRRVGADGVVIVTVFVNPLQFGAGEDFERYPRQLAADVEACAAEGVDAVFAPSAREMYPDGEPQTRVVPGPLGDVLEGAVRSGHFGGMLTVVLKLLNITEPDVALFGEKDYQQLTLIRRMVQDLNLDTTIEGVPTVREPDGLARSSRNAYLSAEQRELALALSRGLRAGQDAAAAGGSADDVLDAAREELGGLPEVDYLELRGPGLEPEPGADGQARLLVAARLGATRLIDNCAITLGES